MQKRVAQVAKNSAAINDVIKLLDLAASLYHLPITQAVVSEQECLSKPEWDAVILDPQVNATSILKEALAPLTFMSSFVSGGTSAELGRSGSYHFVLWPHEETCRTLLGRASPAETWFDASHLSRVAIVEAISQATGIFREGAHPKQGSDRLGWVHMGWVDTEEYALGVLKKMEPEQTVIVPFQNILFAAAHELPRVLVCLPKTALPLARMMDAQSWIAWNNKGGQLLGQASSATGAVFLVRNLLDRLGFVPEALRFEKCILDWILKCSSDERTVLKFCELARRGS